MVERLLDLQYVLINFLRVWHGLLMVDLGQPGVTAVNKAFLWERREEKEEEGEKCLSHRRIVFTFGNSARKRPLRPWKERLEWWEKSEYLQFWAIVLKNPPAFYYLHLKLALLFCITIPFSKSSQFFVFSTRVELCKPISTMNSGMKTELERPRTFTYLAESLAMSGNWPESGRALWRSTKRLETFNRLVFSLLKSFYTWKSIQD